MIVKSPTWLERQRGLRYFLEVRRMLYGQWNEMASAVLDDLQYPAVGPMGGAFERVRGTVLLTSVEHQGLELLSELLDPFASHSPFSLYQTPARTVDGMEVPMTPLLLPIFRRSHPIRGYQKCHSVTIYANDGAGRSELEQA
ncbi:LOW QUALITY PROTEIN: hypothetical protein Q4I31_005080 [Leishmania lindenbergi]|uniref:Uncharacterized protein n=1 Tax=Leishmania lindenbergi TaxID=651832 RepID=A0AAW3A9G2_9TRYP